MSQQDFLAKFQESMTKLNMVRGNIQTSIQSKKQFTNELKSSLQKINERLQQLSGLIKDLKNKADNLEGQITTNAASIGNKDMELQKLREQVTALTTERDNLIAKATQQDNDAKTMMQQSQDKIDQYERQLRDLIQEAETKTAEVNALREEMTKTGDAKDAAHVQQLAQLTEQSRQQLEQQEAQLKQKETELMQRINECQGKIAGFEQQIRERDALVADKQRLLDEQILQAQNSGTAVQAEIAALKKQNDLLIDRLTAATTAIYQSAQDLEMLMASVPNVQTKQEIDVLLNSINQQIEQSLQNISAATQGRQPMPVQQMPVQQMPVQQMPLQQMQGQPLDRNAKIPIKGNQMSINALVAELKRKANQFRNNSNNKYNIALNRINNEISSLADIPKLNNILGVDINITNGVVSGGKGKTRKNKTQKGGFTYKRTTRRQRVTSKSKFRNTSRTRR